jgi:hypothetical protein
MADMHEADMAEWIVGRLSKSSGNQWSDLMDVKNGSRDVSLPMAGDGKSTCGQSMSLSRKGWEKARQQAGPTLEPFLAHRWYEDETLHKVALDLVTVDKEFFVRVLAAARAWEDQREMLRNAVQNNVQHMSIGLPGEQVTFRMPQAPTTFAAGDPDYEANQAAWEKDLLAAEPHVSGCDCCR